MRLTKDDERARRICSLAIEFMNARAPIASSALAARYYPELSADSFRRAFSRDRALLAACGVRVVERGRQAGETSWGVDERGSFAGGAELGAREAATLELTCQGVLEDPAFPLAGDLRLALAKLSRAFADEPAFAAARRNEGRALGELRRALVEHLCVEASYTNARGWQARRTLAPYGLFALGGSTYLVAARVTDGAADGPARTYRVDRFDEVVALDDVPCEVPDDFSVLDWVRLPFQLGSKARPAAFAVPDGREGALADAARGQGELTREGKALVWEVDVCDLPAAASWAVAQGIRPLRPQALVDAWREVLEGALPHGA